MKVPQTNANVVVYNCNELTVPAHQFSTASAQPVDMPFWLNRQKVFFLVSFAITNSARRADLRSDSFYNEVDGDMSHCSRLQVCNPQEPPTDSRASSEN